MRNLLFILAIFLSLHAMADPWVLHIQAKTADGYEYSEDLRLTPSSQYPGVGDVEMDVSFGRCTGYYIQDWRSGMRVTFDGLNGRGSTGGCHNESMDLDMNIDQYVAVAEGQSVEIEFHTQRYYNVPLKATISRSNS